MRRVPFSPDTNLYLKHYRGNGLPVFSGTRDQSGYGIGSFFSSLKRSVMPILQSTILPILKSTGKNVLRSTGDLVSDVLENKESLKSSALRRGKEGLKRSAIDALPIISGIQSGRGAKRKRLSTKNKKKVSKRKKDIFDW